MDTEGCEAFLDLSGGPGMLSEKGHPHRWPFHPLPEPIPTVVLVLICSILALPLLLALAALIAQLLSKQPTKTTPHRFYGCKYNCPSYFCEHQNLK